MLKLEESNRTIDSLAEDYAAAKLAVDEAREDLQTIEQEIIELLGHKPEGPHTFDGDEWVIKTTGKLTRRVDLKQIDKMRELIPPPIFDKLFRVKPELDLRSFRALEFANPEMYRVACLAITTTPAKPSIEVERRAANV
jgi:hypothetical protein